MTEVKLEKLILNHFGSLQQRELEFGSGLNAYFGENESGKTLMVEAITKMLVDDRSVYQELDRVEADPNGSLMIEKDSSSFDASRKDLNFVFEDAASEDIRNAFIIRDFDLRLPERKNDFGKGNYFSSVTDRILGSKTQKIQSLREEISDIGYLTNDSLDRDPGLKNTQGTGKLKDKRKKANDLIKEIEKFRKEISAKDVMEKYSRLNSIQENIEDLEQKEEKLEEARKQSKYEAGKNLIQDLEDVVKKEERLEEDEKWLKRLNNLDEKIVRTKDMDAPVRGLNHKLAYLSGLSTVVLAGASVLYPMTFLGVVITLVAALYFEQQYRSRKGKRKKKENEIEDLMNNLKAEGLEAESLEEARNKIDSLEKELKDRRDGIVKEKQDIETTLKEKFDTEAEDLEGWREAVEDFEKEFAETDIEYSEEKEEEFKQDKKDFEKKRKKLKDKIESYDDRISNIDSEYQKIPVKEFLECSEIRVDSVDDLPKVKKRLEEFVDYLNETVEVSVKALEVLEEMEEEEEDEFNSLFEDDSYAVDMFKEATDENYVDINYDRSMGILKVERVDGKILPPQKLSQGTYDLLYMSIRLSLAQKILGEPGFLILDNAFVHSDIERVREELEFLSKLEDQGWQIIYFTFRDDIKDTLEDKTEVKELEKIDY